MAVRRIGCEIIYRGVVWSLSRKLRTHGIAPQRFAVRTPLSGGMTSWDISAVGVPMELKGSTVGR